jgi:hypothetical protein
MEIMSVLAIVVLTALALAAFAGAAVAVLRRRRRRQMTDPLHGDWWTQFEEAFRDYAMGISERQRETEQ